MTSFPRSGVVLLVVVVMGCGADTGGVEFAGATGVVTHNGNPLANARVTAVPEKGPVAIGLTDEAGKFSLTSGEFAGVAVGTIRIAVTVADPSSAAQTTETPSATPSDDNPNTAMGTQSMMKYAEANKKKKKAPLSPLAKYADVSTSGFSFPIKPGPNELKVDLK